MYFFIKSLGKMSKFSPEVGVNLVDNVPEGFSVKFAELEDAKETVVQVNLCQKHLFLHQPTHIMM